MGKLLNNLIEYFKNTPQEILDKDFKELESWTKIGPDAKKWCDWAKEQHKINSIMSKIEIKQVKITNHLELNVSVEENISTESLLSLEYNDKTYYFKPSEIVIDEKSVIVTLRECGYWARRLYRMKEILNYKDLISMKLSVITDKEKIKQINTESTWC